MSPHSVRSVPAQRPARGSPSASGLVVTYLSAGILNFSFGAIAYAIARLYYSLHTEHAWGIVPAFVLSVFVVAPVSWPQRAWVA